eukprot:TRINITY_DN74440_c0_g1_i1.p1 TRINITY_DN74440_c0_g1~~TRINITY_DN74440_c0_g1_i1.p1  ORF type:complete len:198 (+),score=23.12 TRINITY_DN74440_c0_g1_i1:22-615(+)
MRILAMAPGAHRRRIWMPHALLAAGALFCWSLLPEAWLHTAPEVRGSWPGMHAARSSGRVARGSNSLVRRYKVVLETPDGEESFECSGDTFILDQADDLGLELPWSCRTGECSICTGRLLEGTIDQSTQRFLTDEQVADGYCLTCVTKPTSDVRLRTHQDNVVAPVKVSEEERADAGNLGIFGDSGDGGGGGGSALL